MKNIVKFFVLVVVQFSVCACSLTDGIFDYGYGNKMAKSLGVSTDFIQEDVDKKNIDGVTQLMVVAGFGDMDSVYEILKLNPDLNAQDNNGWTALMYAVYKNRYDNVKKLIDVGADLNAVDNEGNNVVVVSILFTKNVDIFQLIAESTADLSYRTPKGNQNLLMLAVRAENDEIVEYLVEKFVYNERMDEVDSNDMSAYALTMIHKIKPELVQKIKQYTNEDSIRATEYGLCKNSENGTMYRCFNYDDIN